MYGVSKLKNILAKRYEMKVIFLDIDGVLISLESLLSENVAASPECVENLNQLTAETGSVIVVSSSWKKLGKDKVTRFLREWGVSGDVIGVTPSDDRLQRGQEIQQWLDNNKPDVEAFAILDDCGDMAGLSDYLIQTDDEKGLTREDVIKAVSLIRRQI